MASPQRGEVWIVQFEPQVGREIMKARPAVVLSVPTLNYLPLRIIVPIRDADIAVQMHASLVPILPSTANGLVKASVIDVGQVHSFDIRRFIKRIGAIEDELLERVVVALSQAVGL
jgi:mRNA interferase MazF